MISIKRSNSTNLDFQNLVFELDKYLAIKNGEMNDFFVQHNQIDKIKNVIIAYDEANTPVGCGAMKEYEKGVMEIKRMFVQPNKRGKGIAGEVLSALQVWAIELGYEKCILETGDQMLEAISLYKKHNFKSIPNYGQYAAIESSVCFEKKLSQTPTNL